LNSFVFHKTNIKRHAVKDLTKKKREHTKTGNPKRLKKIREKGGLVKTKYTRKLANKFPYVLC